MARAGPAACIVGVLPDDRARIVMRINSEGPAEPESAEFVIELPSDVRRIEAAVGYLVGRCREFLSGPRLELNFRVGVTEAIANAVNVNYTGQASAFRDFVQTAFSLQGATVSAFWPKRAV